MDILKTVCYSSRHSHTMPSNSRGISCLYAKESQCRDYLLLPHLIEKNDKNSIDFNCARISLTVASVVIQILKQKLKGKQKTGIT